MKYLIIFIILIACMGDSDARMGSSWAGYRGYLEYSQDRHRSALTPPKPVKKSLFKALSRKWSNRERDRIAEFNHQLWVSRQVAANPDPCGEWLVAQTKCFVLTMNAADRESCLAKLSKPLYSECH